MAVSGKIFIVSCLVLAAICEGLVYDPVATIELDDVIRQENIVLLMKQTKPTKRTKEQPESLLEIRFPGEIRRFSIKLNREKDTVTLEGGDSILRWSSNGLGSGGPLAFEFQQMTGKGTYVTLYQDCEPLTEFHAPISFRDIFLEMEQPAVKLFHEKRFPLSVLGGPAADVLGCEPREDKKFENHHKHHTTTTTTTTTERMQAQQPYDENDVAQRGDIPIIHTDNCDDLLVKSINDLILVIRQLKAEVERQRGEVHHLRNTIENCAGCRDPPTPQRIPTCASGTCFTGE